VNGALSDLLNFVLVPLRLLIPQPIVARMPVLRTSRDERIRQALALYGGRVLDIGCGTNELVRRYRDQGGDGIGVDTHAWAGVDCQIADSASLPWPEETFDTVSFVASLNHIPERWAALREAHRLLRPGGRLVITNLTPRVSQLWHRIAFWDPDQHVRTAKQGEVWGFSDAELVRMVHAAGFRLVRRQPFMWHLNHVYLFRRSDDGDAR
jgi:ubiquinone/menaquinone biosynthesis C-methylase UbiE